MKKEQFTNICNEVGESHGFNHDATEDYVLHYSVHMELGNRQN